MNTTARNIPAHMPESTDKLSEAPDQVINAANKLGKLSDRGWLAFLMLIGIGVLGVMLYWHREDQKAMTQLFSETIRSNTEMLSRCAIAIERLDRK